MIEKSKLLKIGSLAKPHGVTGEMLIRLLPEWHGYEPDPDFLFIDLQGGLVPFEVHAIRYRNDQDLLVILDTISTEEKARRVQSADVYIDPEELGQEPAHTEFSIHQLVGFEVTDKNMGALGPIRSVADIQNNPLIELFYKEREILVPIHSEFIVRIDMEKRQMDIDAPAGLIELYLE
ncbi:ribosome maturation factor RimM [Geofilum rubicundum]|nr:ribosome maturation factor RimM [Geofilum rubicundum]